MNQTTAFWWFVWLGLFLLGFSGGLGILIWLDRA